VTGERNDKLLLGRMEMRIHTTSCSLEKESNDEAIMMAGEILIELRCNNQKTFMYASVYIYSFYIYILRDCYSVCCVCIYSG